MKFIDLQGREINVQLLPSRNPIGKVFRSEIQTSVGEKLTERFPQESILEDWILPKSRLSLDFFIPRLKLAIEVSPEGTHTYSAFFHGQKSSGKFYKQVNRDSEKARFCELNSINLIVIQSEKDFILIDKL